MAGDSFNEGLLSTERPTVFELFAKESMESSLRPAITYVIKTIYETSPERFGWVWRVKDELATSVHALVDGYFIFRCNATFAEYFYSLWRVSGSNGQKLSFCQELITFLSMVAVPYVQCKLEGVYINHVSSEDDGSYYLKLIPIVHFVVKCIEVMFRLAYLLRRTSCYSPSLWITNTVLQRSTSISNLFPTGLLTVCAYVLRFLEWWYASDSLALHSAVTLPSPPPPLHLVVPTDGDRTLCPICQKPYQNPSAVATSGFVFCYSCILDRVHNSHHCPLTRIATNEHQIIRLYTQ